VEFSKGGFNYMNKSILRGDLYYADLNPITGSEQGGIRPVLIIQNNVGNKYSPTVIIAAITSKSVNTLLPTQYLLPNHYGLDRKSIVLLEQIRTIDKKRLKEHVGVLKQEHMRCVDAALAVSLGLIDTLPLIMCLCPACANNFYCTDSYFIHKVNAGAFRKEICTYCNVRQGCDYVIIPKENKAKNSGPSGGQSYV
jgi:mRNA interferase MazF